MSQNLKISNAFSLDQYLNLPTGDTPWLVEPILPIGGLCNIYGRQKSGKSVLANQLGICLALGHSDFLGWTLPGRPVKVLYIQLDTPRVTWKDRYENLVRHGMQLPNSNFYICDKETGPYPFDILQPSHQGWLRRQVESYHPELVILDILREIHRGDEDNSGQMQQVLSQVDLACRPAAVMLVSHGKKPPSDPSIDVDLMDEGRGSSHVSARCDTVLRLKRIGQSNKFVLDYKGRSVDDTQMRLIRDDGTPDNKGTYFYSLDGPDPFKVEVDKIMRDDRYKTNHERAKALEAITGEAFEKCHSAIKRSRPAS